MGDTESLEAQDWANGDNMSSAVALDGQFRRGFNYAAIGVQWDTTPKHPDGGSVYLFDTENVEDLNIPASVDPTDELALIC